jgi:hypothetical protein
MDLVYLNADLTMIAAAGDNSDAGLPGVSSVQRIRQQQAQIGKHLLSTMVREAKASTATPHVSSLPLLTN